jgi:hypothetical protein
MSIFIVYIGIFVNNLCQKPSTSFSTVCSFMFLPPHFCPYLCRRTRSFCQMSIMRTSSDTAPIGVATPSILASLFTIVVRSTTTPNPIAFPNYCCRPLHYRFFLILVLHLVSCSIPFDLSDLIAAWSFPAPNYSVLFISHPHLHFFILFTDFSKFAGPLRNSLP